MVFDEVRFDMHYHLHGSISLYYQGECVFDREFINTGFLRILDMNPVIAHEYNRQRAMEAIMDLAELKSKR